VLLDRLAGLDRVMFHWVNRDHRNAFFDWLMPFLSSEGHFKPLFVILFLALLVFGKARGRAAALLVIPLLVISDQTASHFLKHAFDRLRPCLVLPDVVLQAGCGTSFSMPSSHAANTSAAAVHFALFYPRLALPLLFVAFGVCYSRVYVGVHWPFDVIVGFLVGAASAFIVQFGYQAARAAVESRRTAKRASM